MSVYESGNGKRSGDRVRCARGEVANANERGWAGRTIRPSKPGRQVDRHACGILPCEPRRHRRTPVQLSLGFGQTLNTVGGRF